VAGLFFTINYASAATLNIIPSSGLHNIGEIFSVSATVSSPDQALNAVDGTITFPTDILEVTAISKQDSILNLWVEEPVYSNSTGRISFSGVAVNPGFTGANGKVLKINFKIKKSGSGNVGFFSGSILANDGKGTNILTGFNNGSFTFGKAEVVKPTLTPTPVPGPTPVAPNPVISPANNIPIENTTYVMAPEEPFSFFSPVFIAGVKIFIQNLFILALLLLVISLIWFIVIRVSSAITLLKLRLRSEIKTVNLSMYGALRKKIDEDFSEGRYLIALTGYQKLQEQAPASKQSELSEKIILANKFYIVEENFKKAQTLAGKGKWIEAGALVEEGEVLVDSNFKYYDEAKKFYNDVKSHLAEISEKNSAHLTVAKNKLADALRLVEETKNQVIYQQGLFSAEKAKREQLEEEINKQAVLSGEKDKKNTIFGAERESAFERDLANIKEQVLIGRRKLTDAEHEAEEMKSRLSFQERMLSEEKGKREELEKAKMSLEQEVGNKKEEIISSQRKLTDAERTIEEIKSKFTRQDDLVMAEKSKHEQAEADVRNLTASYKEREMTLKKDLEEAERQMNDSKKKFSDVSRHTEETDAQLAHLTNLLNNEKEKLRVSEEENKKYFGELREKEVSLQKALDEANVLKNKELSFKTSLAEADEQVASSKNKLMEALHTTDEAKRQLANAENLLVTEKGKRERAEKESDTFAGIIKEQNQKLEKRNADAEAKFQVKEDALNKKIAEAEEQAKISKSKLVEAEHSLEEAKTKLSKEQDLLVAEKRRTESLSAAISKLIIPKEE